MKTGTNYNKSQLNSIAAQMAGQIVQHCLKLLQTEVSAYVAEIVKDNDPLPSISRSGGVSLSFLIDLEFSNLEELLLLKVGDSSMLTVGQIHSAASRLGYATAATTEALVQLKTKGILRTQPGGQIAARHLYLTSVGWQVHKQLSEAGGQIAPV